MEPTHHSADATAARNNEPAVAAVPIFSQVENVGLTLLLAAMIILPLAEILLRQFSVGIPSAPDFLRHLTLLVGMAGGAIAAREGRLLALATGGVRLPGRTVEHARFYAQA